MASGEQYLIGEIYLNVYKAEKVVCDELLLKKCLYRSIGTGETEAGRTDATRQPTGSRKSGYQFRRT